MLCLAIVLVPMAALGEEFYQDFRGGAPLHPAVGTFGGDAARHMKPESAGLRLSLSATPGEEEFGVSPRFRISGDFEVTVAYEVLAVDKPKSGWGAGLKVWGQIGGSDFEAINMAHRLCSDGKEQVVALFSRPGSGGKRVFDQKTRETTVRKGQLRVARRSSEVTFLATKGENDEFQELHRVEARTDDLPALRIMASAGGTPTAVNVRLLDLRITADRLGGAARPPERRGIGWLVACVVGVIVVASGVWAWRKRLWSTTLAWCRSRRTPKEKPQSKSKIQLPKRLRKPRY
jgi:hypothetical protein